MKTYNETSATLKVLTTNDKQETETSYVMVTETQKKKIDEVVAEEAKKIEAKGGTSEQSKLQTFTISLAENWDEIATLVPNEAARLAHFNRGFGIAQTQARRDIMLDPAEAIKEGNYDLLPEVQEPTERRKASTEDKAKKLLADLDPEALARILAQFASGGAPQAVSA